MQGNYPVAAALSFVFMAIVMVIVIVYARHPRHRGPRRERRRSGTVTSPGGRDRARASSTSRPRFGAALPVPADLRDRRVQLQRAEGHVQRGLAEVHARQLAPPVRRQAARRRADPEPARSRSISTIIATILGTFIAIALVRYRFRGGEPVNFLLVLPLTAPEIVLGASLLTLFLEPHLVLFNHSFQLGFDDDPDRAHHVLRELRRADRQGADAGLRLDARGRRDGPRREPDPHVPAKVTLPLITPGHPRRRVPAVVRAVDRRLHHHVLRVGPEHDDVPGADLRPVAHRDPAADQRARDDDPLREHHRARGRYRLGRVPRTQLRRAMVRQRLAAFFVLMLAVAAGSIPAAGAISPIQPDNRPLPLPGVTNGEVPPSLLVQVAPNCVTARAAGPSLSLLFAEARAVGVSLGSEECYPRARGSGDRSGARDCKRKPRVRGVGRHVADGDAGRHLDARLGEGIGHDRCRSLAHVRVARLRVPEVGGGRRRLEPSRLGRAGREHVPRAVALGVGRRRWEPRPRPAARRGRRAGAERR